MNQVATLHQALQGQICLKMTAFQPRCCHLSLWIGRRVIRGNSQTLQGSLTELPLGPGCSPMRHERGLGDSQRNHPLVELS